MVNNDSEEYIKRLRKLTKRELEVLILRCQALDYKSISLKLGITVNSVKQFMSRIYIKLELEPLYTQERIKVLYEVYCPLIKQLYETWKVVDPKIPVSEELSSEEELSEPFEPIPPEVVTMVDDDENAIIVFKPNPIIPIPKIEEDPRKFPWLVVVLLLGLCSGIAIYYWLLQSNLIPSINFSQPTQPSIYVEGPVVEVTRLVTQTPGIELPTQTAEVVVKTIVISATPPPATKTPTQVPTPSVSLPFEDTFDLRARQEWDPIIGTWRVVDNHLTANLENSIILIGDQSWTDYSIEFSVFTDDYTQPIRAIIRYSDSGYMAIQFNTHTLSWILSYQGQETIIAESTSRISKDKVSKIRIDVNGDIYTAYTNGTQVLQIQDTTLTHGKVGLAIDTWFASIWFDDFQITAIK